MDLVGLEHKIRWLAQPFDPESLTQLVRDYVTGAGTGKTASCHRFRLAMATLMLENGADVRFIQHILSHENLSTTDIYTRVSMKKIKEVHDATHPANGELAENGGDGDAKEESLSAMEAEAVEEG